MFLSTPLRVPPSLDEVDEGTRTSDLEPGVQPRPGPGSAGLLRVHDGDSVGPSTRRCKCPRGNARSTSTLIKPSRTPNF